MIVSLCSGVGGLDMAVEDVFRLPIAAHAEPERVRLKRDGPLVPNPVLRVLEARFPGVPNLGDITATDWSLWAGLCTVLCAGFPCQPVSAAGRQLAENDERWLWPAVHRAIVELAPEWVVLENVANIVNIQGGHIWRKILTALQMSGYDVAWGVFGACLIGACHHRHRMFLVARRGGGAEAARWAGGPCSGTDWVPLPTPRAGDAHRGPHRAGRTFPGHERTGDLTAATVHDFEIYAGAVGRWVSRFGPAPAPSERGMPGQRGGVRMAAPFPEWMMGLAPGYVTGLLPRNDALRAIGNGVMPQQGKYAIHRLLDVFEESAGLR